MKFPTIDSPVVQKLSDIGDMILVNFVYCLLCVPVFTIGAATAALHYTTFCMREEKPHGVMVLLRAFKENFKQGTLLFLIVLGIGALIGADYYFCLSMDFPGNSVIAVIIAVFGIVLLMVSSQLFLLQAHFTNTLRQMLKNALVIALMNPLRSVLMAALWALPWILLFAWFELFLRLSIILYVIYYAFISFLSVRLMEKKYADYTK